MIKVVGAMLCLKVFNILTKLGLGFRRYKGCREISGAAFFLVSCGACACTG